MGAPDPPSVTRSAAARTVHEVGDAFAFVLGTWALGRELHDRLTGTTGHLRATASVTPNGARSATASYLERGELAWGAHRGPAERRLVYESTGTGAVAVRFADGRPFFRLDLRHGPCRAVHVCRDDRYEIEVVALGAARLEERWRVLGPAKDYEATTILTRLPAGSL